MERLQLIASAIVVTIWFVGCKPIHRNQDSDAKWGVRHFTKLKHLESIALKLQKLTPIKRNNIDRKIKEYIKFEGKIMRVLESIPPRTC